MQRLRDERTVTMMLNEKRLLNMLGGIANAVWSEKM